MKVVGVLRYVEFREKLANPFRNNTVNFDVLLTVHLSTILAINQLNAQNLLL